MLKYFLILFLFFISVVSADDKALKLSTDEGLFLRRVAEFYEEKEFDIVKKEINGYLTSHEKNGFSDYLTALLGDLFLQEKKYQDALGQYQAVSDPLIKDKIFFNVIQCLYETQSLDKVVFETKEYLKLQKQPNPKVISLLADTLYQLSLLVKETDKQKELLLESKGYYEQMLALDNKEEAYEPLAHIFDLLNQPQDAYKYYLLLSQKDSDEKEYFLFQAAQIAVKFDKKKAIEHFDAIYQMNGQKAFDALFNKFLLHFDQKEYDQIVKVSPDVFRKLSKDQAIELRYVVGKSFYALKDYKKSIKHLKRFISLADPKNERMHSALTYLMSASCEIKDTKSFFLSSEHFKVYFPNDPEMGKVLYAHGLFHKELKNYKEAFSDFETIEAKYPEYVQKIDYQLQASELCYLMQNYEGATKKLASFYDKLTDSVQRKQALILLVNATIQMQNNIQQKDSLVYQKLLNYLNDLTNLATLSDQEKAELIFLRGHLQIQMCLYDAAINDLNWYKEHVASKDLDPKFNLLLAIAYKEGKKDLLQFATFAEKAIDQDPVWAHQALFNAYRELGETKPEYFTQAADHLFHLMQRTTVEKNNLFWLADFYFDSFKKNPTTLPLQDQNFLRAKVLLEKLYVTQEEKNSEFEKIALKLFELYTKESLVYKQKEILHELEEQYQKHADQKFAYKPLVYFELASLYEKEKNLSSMEQYYTKILKETEKNPYIPFAQLFKVRKDLQNIALEQFNLTNPTVITILDDLKNLKLQRHIASEPAHLEAALDLIDLQVALEKDNPIEKKCYLLEKAQKDFASNEDIVSKDYHALREKMLDKNALYLTYMTFMQMEERAYQAIIKKDSLLMKKTSEEIKAFKGKILSSYLQKRLEKLQNLILENEKKN
jgi:hypothetical protein